MISTTLLQKVEIPVAVYYCVADENLADGQQLEAPAVYGKTRTRHPVAVRGSVQYHLNDLLAPATPNTLRLAAAGDESAALSSQTAVQPC